MNPPYQIAQGDILLTKCEPSVGAEMRKIRPCVVIQSDRLSRISSLITVVPITSQIENPFFADIAVAQDQQNHLHGNALVRTSQIFTYDRLRFIKLIGKCSHLVLREIKKQLIENLELASK